MKDTNNEETKSMYSMQYHCSNCGGSFRHSFPYGQRASQPKCPLCGVEPYREKVRWDDRRF